MSVSYNSCYVIDNKGNLYGIEDYGNYSIFSNDNRIKQWTNIPLPKNNKKFIQCANGDSHLICLVEDNKGNYIQKEIIIFEVFQLIIEIWILYQI